MYELETAKAGVVAAIQEGTQRKACSSDSDGGGGGGGNEDTKCRESMAKQAEWKRYGT